MCLPGTTKVMTLVFWDRRPSATSVRVVLWAVIQTECYESLGLTRAPYRSPHLSDLWAHGVVLLISSTDKPATVGVQGTGRTTGGPRTRRPGPLTCLLGGGGGI